MSSSPDSSSSLPPWAFAAYGIMGGLLLTSEVLGLTEAIKCNSVTHVLIELARMVLRRGSSGGADRFKKQVDDVTEALEQGLIKANAEP